MVNMRKEVTLVAGSEATRENLHRQLKEDMPEEVLIHSYSLERAQIPPITSDLLLVSGESIGARLTAEQLVAEHCQLIVAKRTVNYDHIDLLVTIAPGTTVLLVNDTRASAEEAVESLRLLGLSHLHYIPYYPQREGVLEKVGIAVSVGESDKVPGFVSTIYEIGTRIVSLQTMVELMNCLNLSTDVIGKYTDSYLNKIINIAKRFAVLNSQVKELNQHLRAVMDSMNDGLLVFDRHTEEISVLNENLRELLGIRETNLAGKKVAPVVNSPAVAAFIQNQPEGEERFLNLRGHEVLARKFAVQDSVVCTFKQVETARRDSEKIRQNLIRKGFFGKHTFDDILGSAAGLQAVKSRLEKFSRTDLTILIEGESGTGKELFASAVHNNSARKDMPFVAVNFSALHDSLLESELFGYDEGSFTGASKGGKEGIFELADGGTIFLDEIGDISEKMQARLLRVLQEKEVLRVGGKEIRKVDIRIIAATNRDLQQMVAAGTFRRDLYHRLKVGYVRIPPVRERKSDIPILIAYFLRLHGSGQVKITTDTLAELIGYPWYGNVRELENTVIYMLALKEGDEITASDLPEAGFFESDKPLTHITMGETATRLSPIISGIDDLRLNEIGWRALSLIEQANRRHQLFGRVQLLHELSQVHDLTISEYQVRKLLTGLAQAGFLHMSRGKVGLQITESGRQLLGSLAGGK